MARCGYSASDTLLNAGGELEDATLLDFWQWAYADLCDDENKGIFAEWLVARLIGITKTRRIGWANSDLITPDGVRIEIKSSSYWQSWKLIDEFGVTRQQPLYPVSNETRIAFAGLKARDAVAVPDPSIPPEFKSHVYIFAFQREAEVERWNALDLSQWEFYVLPANRIRELGWKSVSLKSLRVEHPPLSASDLRPAALRVIDDVKREMGIPAHPSEARV
jgi:hypothetical protein